MGKAPYKHAPSHRSLFRLLPRTSLLVCLWSFPRDVLRRHLRLLAGLVLGFLAPWLLYPEIAEEIWEGNGYPGDQPILQFLHAHATPTLDALAPWFELV